MMRRVAALIAISIALPCFAGDRAEVVGSYVWKEPLEGFGGVSAIDLWDGGLSFRAMTDTGMTLAGRFARTSDGVVSGVSPDEWTLLQGEDPYPLAEQVRDAEGISVRSDGSFYVAFEQNPRIEWYRDATSVAKLRADGIDLSNMPHNRAFESVAEGPDGAVYTMPELPPTWGGPFPVQVLRDGKWSTPFSIPSDGTWSAVGLDFGPDGRLYLLERDYWGLVGFMSRIRRITLSGDTVAGIDLLWQTRAGAFPNFEGIAVWQDEGGMTRLTLVSDDNFLPFWPTTVLDLKISS